MSGIRLTQPYIYKLVLLKDVSNFKEGECYIGKHCGSKREYYTSGTIPLNLVNAHGSEIFKREILSQGNYDSDELNRLERRFIEKYECCRPLDGKGLNLTRGGDGVGDGVLAGERNPSRKLTKGQVEEILEIFKSSNILVEDLAERYSVSNQTIYRIVVGKTWKHVRTDIDRNVLKQRIKRNKEAAKLRNIKKGGLQRRRLTPSQVQEIRHIFKNKLNTIRALGEEFGLSYGSISDIVYGRSYKDI